MSSEQLEKCKPGDFLTRVGWDKRYYVLANNGTYLDIIEWGPDRERFALRYKE